MIDQLNRRNQAFAGLFGPLSRTRVNLVITAGGSEPLKKANSSRVNILTPCKSNAQALGRLIAPEDIDAALANPVCVISYALWQSRFAGDPGILGRKVLLNAHLYSIVGVTEKGFFGPQLQARVDFHLPVSRMGDFMGEMGSMWKSPDFSWLEPLARLKPGLTLVQAQGMIDPLARAVSLELKSPAQAPHRQSPAVAETYHASRMAAKASTLTPLIQSPSPFSWALLVWFC